MNKFAGRILLQNLLARIVVDPETGNGSLPGVLTAMEIEALKGLCDDIFGENDHVAFTVPTGKRVETTQPAEVTKEIPDEVIDPAGTVEVESLHDMPISDPRTEQEEENPNLIKKIKLNLASLANGHVVDEEIRMCLDFGTAMSKAFACERDEEDIYNTMPLQLGRRASGGKSKNIYPVPSSLWINNNGRIFFGEEATTLSTQADPTQSKPRFDSLKKELILGLKEGSPFNEPMQGDLNPTDVNFSNGDAIVTYLAFLIDIACLEMEDKYSCSRYTARSYALPSWDAERRAWGEKMLKDMLCKAQVVADTFSGQWSGGLSMQQVRQVLDDVYALTELPEYLFVEGITEPLAVGSATLRQDRATRGLVMVVDVGAGTSDIALFVTVEDPKRGLFNAFPIKGGNMSLHQAGDAIDSALLRLILKKGGISPSDHDYRLVLQNLKMNIRTLKEDLFRDGLCAASLVNGASVFVAKDEFLAEEAVKRFESAITGKCREVLGVLKTGILEIADGGLDVVLTGGGASLPMVQNLAKGIEFINGSQLRKNYIELVPEFVEGNAELEAVFPQMAVAIGGTMPVIINEKNAVEDIDIIKGNMKLSKTQVTGV